MLTRAQIYKFNQTKDLSKHRTTIEFTHPFFYKQSAGTEKGLFKSFKLNSKLEITNSLKPIIFSHCDVP